MSPGAARSTNLARDQPAVGEWSARTQTPRDPSGTRTTSRASVETSLFQERKAFPCWRAMTATSDAQANGEAGPPSMGGAGALWSGRQPPKQLRPPLTNLTT